MQNISSSLLRAKRTNVAIWEYIDEKLSTKRWQISHNRLVKAISGCHHRFMVGYHQKISLFSEADTQRLAKRIGQLLMPGDVILLRGEIGSGKSFFVRALIQSLQDMPEDVPSPTFTLIQTYITKIGEIWHADLYRLTAPCEIDELGLLDAFETAITLVEWPEILSLVAPSSSLYLDFKVQQDGLIRDLSLSSKSSNWSNRLGQQNDI